MSAEVHMRNMVLRLMSLLEVLDPAALADQLERFGFEPGDVTFEYGSGPTRRRRERQMRPRCVVHCWPWERAVPTDMERGQVKMFTALESVGFRVCVWRPEEPLVLAPWRRFVEYERKGRRDIAPRTPVFGREKPKNGNSSG